MDEASSEVKCAANDAVIEFKSLTFKQHNNTIILRFSSFFFLSNDRLALEKNYAHPNDSTCDVGEKKICMHVYYARA